MKGVIVHGLLALFGLVFAYQTWTRKPEEAAVPGSVMVAECSADALQKITLSSPTLELDVEPKREGGETKFWITTRHKSPEVKDKDKDKGAAGGAAETPAAKDAAATDKPKAVNDADKPRRFLANATFDEYLKRVTPLRAQRSLGKLAKEQDKEFGFDNIGTHMQMQCAGRTLEFDAGARAFGASQRYVRDPKSQTTYLVDEQLLSDLESASFKFMQTDLHTWKPDQVEELSVEAQGAKKKLIQRDRKLAEQALWVDADAPAKRNELYGNWVNRLGKLRARSYLPVGAEPGSDLKNAGAGSEQVLKVDYKVADHPAGKLELVRVDENGVGHYYARSETTGGWVALYDSSAKEVEQDVGMVVGVESASSSKTDKPAPAGNAPPAAPAHGLPPGHPPMPAGH